MKPEYEGKAKQILTTSDPHIVIQRFKDSATAFNGEKYAEFLGKGKLNNAISSWAFTALHDAGVTTHFLEHENANDMRVKRLKIIPLEVVVRNVVAGSLHKRIGMPEGTALENPIVETYYKRDDLGDPLLAETHVIALGLADKETLTNLYSQALKVNNVLQPVFKKAGIRLVDFKLEFGCDENGTLILGDEISPDTCRLWDWETGQKLDKDVFRRDLADLIETYEDVAKRLGVKVQ